ncbi:hypothetical protein [Marinobacter sp. SS13-12]|jgi:hypothetical protein|uniref:hypothetical protein n=1 Tax=Marinobacter sp. SS13-12 TaxID=3050451 RepID=UPI002555C8EB|nr:hypothetical protein [Marinobacter sp. SS13-12]MDK8465472.1 hypothetical protein [Marinobacter sp. SS13-12]
MALQGEKLTQAIEHELMLMLASGYEEAAITPASLHKRLVAKTIIKGKLSSLSSRRPLIDRYANLQMERAGIKGAREKSSAKRGRTRAGYKQRYEEAQAEIRVLKNRLDGNISTILDLVRYIESTSPIPVEKLLAGHLLEAYAHSHGQKR